MKNKALFMIVFLLTITAFILTPIAIFYLMYYFGFIPYRDDLILQWLSGTISIAILGVIIVLCFKISYDITKYINKQNK